MITWTVTDTTTRETTTGTADEIEGTIRGWFPEPDTNTAAVLDAYMGVLHTHRTLPGSVVEFENYLGLYTILTPNR